MRSRGECDESGPYLIARALPVPVGTKVRAGDFIGSSSLCFKRCTHGPLTTPTHLHRMGNRLSILAISAALSRRGRLEGNLHHYDETSRAPCVLFLVRRTPKVSSIKP